MNKAHPHTREFLEAVVNEWTWKTEAMRQMSVDLCRLALERGEQGKFSALDLPKRGADDQGGTGIAGSVIGTFAHRDLIAVYGVEVGGKFYAEKVTNAGGNPINCYRLANRRAVEQLLARLEACAPVTAAAVDIEREAIQEELFA
jgi:hypothetical protein